MLNGRLNRRNFVLGEIIYFLMLLFVLQFGGQVNSLPGSMQTILGLISIAIFSLSQLSLLSRRLHDVGRDAPAYKYSFFYTGKSSGLFGLFAKGEKKENKFGKPPKASISIVALLGLDSNNK
jgi:uncharacterized membrane protein YhaH (DUF805 family)